MKPFNISSYRLKVTLDAVLEAMLRKYMEVAFDPLDLMCEAYKRVGTGL